MSLRCSYIDRSKTPNVPCGYLAQAGSKYGFCPRHEVLVPALEEQKAKKEKQKQLEAARLKRSRR